MIITRFIPLLLAGHIAGAQPDILDIANDPANDGAFTTLLTALDVSGLAYLLDQSWSCSKYPSAWWCPTYTVFAPTNDAFDDLPTGTLDRLLNEEFRPHLTDLLLYHIVDGEVFSSDITDGIELQTLNGETIVANVDSEDIIINEEANVVTPDLDAANGVVHVIDAVLLPASATSNIAEIAAEAGFNTLVSLLSTNGVDLAGFISDPGNILTVFAPTDEAFEELLESGFDPSDSDAVTDLLKYHVIEGVMTSNDLLYHHGGIDTVQGSPVSVDSVGNWWSGRTLEINGEATIAKANILASNGIIHVIDSVLTPPPPPPIAGDIPSVASQNPAFSDLVAALTTAELVTILQGEGPFTVFAPTNEAFQKAGIDVTMATKEELTPILLYHVLAGSELLSEDITSSVIQTNPISPTNLLVDVWNGWFHSHIILNKDVKITSPDVAASNGVIHVIDNVLLPPGNIVETAMLNDRFSKLVSLLEGVELDSTLSGDGPFTVFAPTNAAFDHLEDAGLTPEDPEELKNILLYHVVPGNVPLSALEGGDVDTAFVKGDIAQTITVRFRRFFAWWSTGVSILGDENTMRSHLVTPNILAANGVIHAISRVLLPNVE